MELRKSDLAKRKQCPDPAEMLERLLLRFREAPSDLNSGPTSSDPAEQKVMDDLGTMWENLSEEKRMDYKWREMVEQRESLEEDL